MSAPRRAAVELTLACLAALGSVWSWLNASSQVVVAPVTDSEPSTTSINYYPPLVLLALALAAVAGVLAVLAAARWRRHRMTMSPSHPHTP